MSRKANGSQMLDLIGRSVGIMQCQKAFSIKSELINPIDIKPLEVAKIEVFDFIEIWYNRKRLHSSLGYRI